MSRTPQEIWQAVLGELQLQINKTNFITWLKPTKGLSLDNNVFTVGVPNSFVGEWLEKRWINLIKKTLASTLGCDTGVKIQVGFGLLNTTVNGNAASHRQIQEPEHRKDQHGVVCPFFPKYTFDSFVVSDSNRIAYSAALGVAQNPAKTYNPLFIYSGSGLGKTHLLQAIGHTAWNSGYNVLYSNGEQFTNEFINSLRYHTTEDFRLKYRTPDILLMDDVQFFSGKEQTQETFFYTFNDLHNSSHQIVISCDQPPKSLPHLVERLRSRFEWGIIVDITPPDYEARLAILKAKSECCPVPFPQEALETIAKMPIDNIRELEGCINKVMACASIFNEPLTSEVVLKAIEDIYKHRQESRLTPQQILEQVASHYDSTTQAILNKKRDRSTTFLRYIVIYLIREQCSLSLSNIGDFLGYKDHTSILYGYDKVVKALKKDENLKQSVEKIIQELKNL